LVKGGYLVS